MCRRLFNLRDQGVGMEQDRQLEDLRKESEIVNLPNGPAVRNALSLPLFTTRQAVCFVQHVSRS